MLFDKTHARIALMVGLFLPAASLPAQTVSSVRIFTNPTGLQFVVDGQPYLEPVTLLWPQGSKHSIVATSPQTTQATGLQQAQTVYTLGQPVSNLGPIADLGSITADPSLTYIELPYNVSYDVSLDFFTPPPNVSCALVPPPCPIGRICPCPGFVILNGTTYVQNTQLLIGAGGTVTAEAHPNPGWVFGGWLPVPGSGNTSEAFQNTWTVNGPMIIYPIFTQAISTTVTVQSNPTGLEVLVDRTPYYGNVQLDWGLGSVHQLGGISPQYDTSGNLWVFDSWSDGGAYSHSYTVPSVVTQHITLIATYNTGTLVTFLTNPAGLALTVDGRQNYPNYTFAWVPGSTHTVSAPATQVDANGNTWAFQSWSNGGPETQQILVSGVAANNRYTAVYQPAGTININSNPSGVAMQVDAQACPTPCTVAKAVGTTVQVVAPENSSAGVGERLDFEGWSDGAPASRSVTVAAQPVNLAASYKLRYQLQTSSNPPNGAAWTTTPPSFDSYFDPNTRVEVSVTTKPGFQFLDWSGNASGSYPSALVVMSAPQTVVAELNPVPYIAPGGIMNGAAQTRNTAVAPGSAVAIYGINLASNNLASPASLLATTLDSVTVRVDGETVPLFFVSPGQDNIQLPSNLTIGDHTLTVHIDGKPDASEQFTAARNAPGLYNTLVNQEAFAVATHADGSAISATSPARRGEVVTLYGTGFGPYHPQPADGVAVPSGTKYTLEDAAVLLMGDQQIEPVWAGAAAGKVGVAIVQLKIDDSIPHDTNVSLILSVNGAESNSVLLPVE